MRYLTGRSPAINRILLVESGARAITERVIPRLASDGRENIPVDVITCYESAPSAMRPGGRVFRTQDYPDAAARAALAAELTARGVNTIAIVCSGEEIMRRWKWWLAWRLPAKLLIVNENADFFWVDLVHFGHIRRFALTRLGFYGADRSAIIRNAVAFPFTLTFLLLYAAFVRTRRAIRLRFENPI